MRSTTFEVLGMALMALITILTCGVMLTWVYLRETRDGRRRATQPTETDPEGAGARASSPSGPPASERSGATDAPGAGGSGDQRMLAGRTD